MHADVRNSACLRLTDIPCWYSSSTTTVHGDSYNHRRLWLYYFNYSAFKEISLYKELHACWLLVINIRKLNHLIAPCPHCQQMIAWGAGTHEV